MFAVKRTRLAVVAAGALVVVCGPTIGQAAAAAAPVDGKVVSKIGQNVRAKPTTKSKVLATYKSGAIVKIECKVEGQNVDGNKIWYRLAKRFNKQYGWMSARYVKNLAHVNKCT